MSLAYLDGLRFVSTGPCPTCPTCQRNFGESPERFFALCQAGRITSESNFSWHPCDACPDALGGESHNAHGIDDEDTIVHFTLCTDCVSAMEKMA